jgi:hypothetical protein
MARAKISVPKRLAGVKIPKGIRRIGKDVLRHPMGRVIIAEILVQAAAGLLRSQAREGSMTRSIIEDPAGSIKSVRSAGSEAANAVGHATSGTALAIAHAIDNLLAHIHERRSEMDSGEKPKRGKNAKEHKGKIRGKKRKSGGRFEESRMTH